MPKRASRPWERRGIGRCEPVVEAPPSVRDDVPHVTVDGVDYWSDRFYLHHPAELPVDPPSVNACTCGARAPPPLLHRGRLVASLDLKAAIAATYTLDPSWMKQQFPSLADGSVPTLVLHGHKGLSSSPAQALKANHVTSTSSSTMQDKARNLKNPVKTAPLKTESTSARTEVICIDDSSDEDNCCMEPQAATMLKPAAVASNVMAEQVQSANELGESQLKQEEEEDLPPEEGWFKMDINRPNVSNFSFADTVHLTEILPMWLPPVASSGLLDGIQNNPHSFPNIDATDRKLDSNKEILGVDPSIVSRRKHKRGVHHPKYMILFEKRGSVIVLVSTGNMTKPMSTDGSWLQRFEPSTMDSKVSSKTRHDGSDFGHVLADFLQRQSHAAREGEMIPQDFMKKYLGIASLDGFRKSFKFEDSQVHLIATVPGDHAGRHSLTHLGKVGKSRSFLYGPQRVADIVSRLGKTASETKSKEKPWLSESILSDEDRLIFQTTSFGGNWNQKSFTELARSYCGHDDRNQAKISKAYRDDALLERVDVLWPTQEFMNGLARSRQDKNQRKSPDSVLGLAETIERSLSVEKGGFIFLSSKSFNTIDLPCLSRMAMYEPCIPQQMPFVLPPHIKTFGRVFEGNEYALRKRYGAGKAEEFFSWVMLTSACLSLGAQGQAVPDRGLDSDEMTYSNFELGVMFCSRLQGQLNDRLYCWNPTQCMCGRKQKGATMIHLPIPYCLRPSPYQNDPEEAEMCATPYFHEVPEGTGFVGQMALTPLGAAMAASRL